MSENASYSAARCEEQPLDPAVVRMTAKASWNRALNGGQILNQRYLRGMRVGTGQHGSVYLAYDLDNNDREVAIKIVKRNNPREEKQKLLRQRAALPPSIDHVPLSAKLGSQETKIRKEIAIMKKCRHSHVVRLIEVIDDTLCKKIYMVMEYLGGGELKWKNTRDEPVLTVEQCRRICRDVILGLEYLHYQGIIHRDIKPANLVWDTSRSTVKITDFGVSHFSYAQRLDIAGRSKAQTDDPSDPILLDDSDLTKRAGTPFYLAPEVVQSDWDEKSPTDDDYTPPPRPPITKAIDIWAFGITLYSLLFGRTPFTIPDDRPQHEFQIYRIVCTEDWDVPAVMGFDKIPTGGRHPTNPSSEGYIVVNLIDHLLQKDADKRISLSQLKRHPWFLRGIADPDRWLRETSPSKECRLSVTDVETASAMNPVRFTSWGQLTRRVSTFLRGVRRTHRHLASRPSRDGPESRSGVSSAPNMNMVVSRNKSASATMSRKRDKGKQCSAGNESALNLPSRSKSADRCPALKPQAGSSSTTVVSTSRKSRKGSEVQLHSRRSLQFGSPRQPRPTTSSSSVSGTRPLDLGSSEQHPRSSDRRSLFSGMMNWRPRRHGLSLDTSTATSSSQGGTNTSPMSCSEEALRHRGRISEQNSCLGSLTRRVSSWGDRGYYSEELQSMHSEDELSEIVMLQGAGGVIDEPSAHRSVAKADATMTRTPILLLRQTQADRLLNHSDIPSVPLPAGMLDSRQHTPRSTYASPLRQDPYSSREPSEDDDDDSSLWGDDDGNYGVPGPSRVHEREDDDDSDDEGIIVPRAKPIQVRSCSASSPPLASQASCANIPS